MKFIHKVIFILILCCVVDYFGAKLLSYIYINCPSGDIHEVNYAMTSMTEKVVLMGSSKAKHHFVSEIFKDSLQMSVYNAGKDGQGILYHYCVLNAAISRYTPKLIVLDLNEKDIIHSNGFGFDALSVLHPFFGLNPVVDSVLVSRGWSEHFKLLSGFYRYNSKISKIVAGYFSESSNFKGYSRLEGALTDQAIKKVTDHSRLVVDSVKISYVHAFIKLVRSKRIPLVITISPDYKLYESQNHLSDVIEPLAEEYSVKVLDYSGNEFFLTRPDLFRDASHLNHQGAVELTSLVIDQLKDYNEI